MKSLIALVPATKTDLRRAEAAVRAGYPAVAPILPQLLEWLRDCNWPVARILAPLLASVGAPLVPHLIRILETDDLVWKYWVIMVLIPALCPADALVFRPELERLAFRASPEETREELHTQALLALQHFGWSES
jgi:Domain of unknown function (DUF5071)